MSTKTATVERQDVAAPAISRGAVVPFEKPGEAKQYPPKIAKAILSIKRRIHPVAKDGEVEFGRVKYRYPRADDVMDEVIPLLAEEGLLVTQSEVKQVLFETERMLAITYEYTVTNEDGDVWPDRVQRTGLAWVRSSKGEIDDKASNKASTQSEKWFYIKFFGIRTSDAAQYDNDAVVPGDAPDKQITAPKPPKPGSVEAKAIDTPHVIDAQGHSADTWAEAFIAAIEKATAAELDQWIDANKNSLSKLEGYPVVHTKVEDAIGKRRAATDVAAVSKPKPPKPGAGSAPKANPMPDPTEDSAAFLTWLKTKYETFETYEAGEKFWNETVEALDLPREAQEDAMAVWQAFEARHAP